MTGQIQPPRFPPFDDEAIQRIIDAGRNVQQAAQKALTRLNENMREARRAREQALLRRARYTAMAQEFLETSEMRELRSAAVFHLKIIRERQLGLAFVKSEAARVRQELGLTTTPEEK